MDDLRNPPTRRQAIKIAAATALLSVSSFVVGSTARAAVPLRKNVDSLSRDELDNYKHAVGILIQRGLANPAAKDGYIWQANLHNDFERERPDGTYGACEHRSELFFPWHRAHLAGFEFLLRATDPPRTSNVTIPYWDWTKPASGIRFPKAFEDTTSPLFHSGRYLTQDDVPEDGVILRMIQWDAEDVRTRIVQESNWFLFAGHPVGSTDEGPGTLERTAHNTIHPSIGRTMGNPFTASEDPIYWSFHAYIDLVWARWQRVHVSPTHPQFFSTPDAKIWVEPFVPLVKHMAQTDMLPAGYQYGYDYDFSIDTASPIVASGPVTNRTVLTVIKAGERLTQSAPIRLQSPKRKLLQVRNAVVIRDVTYALSVYVHPPSVDMATFDPRERRRFLADAAAIWMSGGHVHRPTTVLFDLTKAIDSFGGGEFSISIVIDVLPLGRDAAVRATANTKLTAAGPLWRSLVLEER